MEKKQKIFRREFIKLGLSGIGGLIAMYFGLIPKDVRSAAFARPIAKDLELESVDLNTAWNKMYELAIKCNMPIGMDETLPHRPRIEKAMLEERGTLETNVDGKTRLRGYTPSIMSSFQGRAKLFFSQSKEMYMGKAKEETGNINISTNEAFENFFLNEYLPKLINMASSHGISLDALVMWLQMAEDATGTRGGVKSQNADIERSRLQILFSYLEMLGMNNGSTLLTDAVSRVDFQTNLEQSIYDAPRLPKVTLGWSDLEPSLLSRGYIYLNEETKINLERNYPTVVKAINEEVKSRHSLQSLRNQLKYACDLYAKEKNTVLDKLLQESDNYGWEELGFNHHGFYGIAGYLWQMANFTEVWAKVVENVATKNFELQGTQKKLSDKDVHSLINRSFKEVKAGKLKKYEKDKTKAKLDLVKDQIGNPFFLELLRKNEANQKASEILQLWDEFTIQTKNYQERERELIRELGKREYDFDFQLALNIGVMNERMDYIKNSHNVIADKIKDHSDPGFSEWQAFLLMSIREIASLPILTDESDEYWGRFSLTDEPYDPYKTLLLLGQFIEKVKYYFAPAEPLSELWRTIEIAESDQYRALKKVGSNTIFDEVIKKRSKGALRDKDLIKLSRTLGITMPVNNSLMRGIGVINRLYKGDRSIFTATNLLPEP